MTKEVCVFDIETNQRFIVELDGEQVVSFKQSLSDVGTL